MTRIKKGDHESMTAFRGPYDQIPGELSASAAPLRKVTRFSEMTPVNLADLQGNPLDKGGSGP